MKSQRASQMQVNNNNVFNNSGFDGFVIDFVTFGPPDVVLDTYRLVLIFVGMSI